MSAFHSGKLSPTTANNVPAPNARLDDPARLAALHRLGLLDTSADPVLDRWTRLASRLLHVPIVLVSIVDDAGQVFKSAVGLPEPWATLRQTPLSHSFCQHTVTSAQPLIIADARQHPLVHDNLAINDLGVIAYAGLPLRTADGVVLGAFCAIDHTPRAWSEDDLATLDDLAAAVTAEINVRRQVVEYAELCADLEQHVHARTAELVALNTTLHQEIGERYRVEATLRQSEARYRATSELTSDYIYAVDVDQHGNLHPRWITGAFARITGYAGVADLDAAGGWQRLIDPDDLPHEHAHLARVLSNLPDVTEYRIRTKTGQPRWLRLHARPEWDDQAGRVVGVVGAAKDITEQKQAELTLHQERDFIAGVLDTAGALVVVLDRDGEIVRFNRACEHITGYTADELRNRSVWDVLLLPEDRARVRQAFARLLDGEFPATDEYVWRTKTNDHRLIAWSNTALLDAADMVAYVISTGIDITEQKRTAQQLTHQARHDALTGLPNRSLLAERLRQTMTQAAARPSHQFATLFLDMDRFKTVNDSFGHPAGDQVLVEVARRLQTCVRPFDTVARLGGDEFAILLEDIRDAAEAEHIAERIHAVFAAPFTLNGHSVVLSASIGITYGVPVGEAPDGILRDADIAMYQAKARGRARHAVFEPSMRANVVAQTRLEADLRQAIAREEFVLHYQPCVALASGLITGVEAVVRWQHPVRGLVPPADFMAVAEETGLIVPLGAWVLRAACEQASAWQAAGLPPLGMAVNLSARQFKDQAFSSTIATMLQETGLAPHRLELELTESSLMDDAESAVLLLGDLAALGVRLSVDDFGTGYSSLGYLKRFPLSTLKIDRSFVRDVPHDANDAAITTAIIAMAHQLGMHVVAEGVETDAQVTFLQQHRCDFAQGYLWSRPLPATLFAQLVRERWGKLPQS